MGIHSFTVAAIQDLESIFRSKSSIRSRSIIIQRICQIDADPRHEALVLRIYGTGDRAQTSIASNVKIK